MNDKILFVPECYGDTLLTEMLLKSLDVFGQTKISGLINHQKGINNVGRILRDIGSKTNKLAVGIIDNDKTVTYSYIKEFKELKKDTQAGLQLKKHAEYNQYLIILDPDYEYWLMNCAKLVDITPKMFGLNIDNINEFKLVTKDVNINKNEKFGNFVKELKQRESIPMMTLQNWLKLIAEGNLPG